MTINGLRLEQTCGACPEQYDVFNDVGRQVAYFRLRHGLFYAQCPYVGGETVYEVNTIGDGLFDESERERQLYLATFAVLNWIVENTLGRK